MKILGRNYTMPKRKPQCRKRLNPNGPAKKLIAVYHVSKKTKMNALPPRPDKKLFNKPDYVYLFTPYRLGLVPSVSPFVLKLETWLRMVEIPYKVIPSQLPSEKTKQFPFILLNGEEICDTNLIIEKLAEYFSKPLDADLSAKQNAVALAFMRMIEEHTFHSYIWYRYVQKPDDFWGGFNIEAMGPEAVKKYSIVSSIIKENVTQKSWHHGIGRKTPEEIFRLAEKDLSAISLILGEKDFMMGDKPSLIDCVMFGHFVQLFYIPSSFPPKLKAESQFPNLVSFTDRMRDRFYPDWENKCELPQKADEI